MLDIPFRSATQLAASIRQKEIGCLELLDLYLRRVERYNSTLNAIIFMDIEAARKRAREADAALAKGEVWGPFHGVPMTIKESYDVVGMPTTWGIPHYKDNYPPAHAVSVDRLLNAGAVLFGKTAYSTRKLPLIPRQTCHRFHGKTATDSTPKLPPIPR
jgi:amidase